MTDTPKKLTPKQQAWKFILQVLDAEKDNLSNPELTERQYALLVEQYDKAVARIAKMAPEESKT